MILVWSCAFCVLQKWQEREVSWEERENELETKLRVYETEERYVNQQLEEVLLYFIDFVFLLL